MFLIQRFFSLLVAEKVLSPPVYLDPRFFVYFVLPELSQSGARECVELKVDLLNISQLKMLFSLCQKVQLDLVSTKPNVSASIPIHCSPTYRLMYHKINVSHVPLCGQDFGRFNKFQLLSSVGLTAYNSYPHPFPLRLTKAPIILKPIIIKTSF